MLIDIPPSYFCSLMLEFLKSLIVMNILVYITSYATFKLEATWITQELKRHFVYKPTGQFSTENDVLSFSPQKSNIMF